jgi:UDP-N-acetylglucosamine 2-epimerase
MNVVSIVGARPQFIKLDPVSRALRGRGVAEFVLHTGQHYDFEMSESFFQEFDLPEPDENLEIGSNSPARQIGALIPRIGDVLDSVKPDLTVVFGDTNSTLAGAIASAYAGIPVAHVEAGMRSFNRQMPEELSRVCTDHLSDLLFTASAAANRNLRREGLSERVVCVGDVMYDVVLRARSLLRDSSAVLRKYGVKERSFVLATVHRASNTDDPEALGRILEILRRIPVPVIFPLHPRTRRAIERAGLEAMLECETLQPVRPIPYLETIGLAALAKRVFTDSGGLQKEAFYVGVPCTTLREETEWVETVELGWNILTGTDVEMSLATLDLSPPATPGKLPYGDGTAGEKIAEVIAGSPDHR